MVNSNHVIFCLHFILMCQKHQILSHEVKIRHMLSMGCHPPDIGGDIILFDLINMCPLTPHLMCGTLLCEVIMSILPSLIGALGGVAESGINFGSQVANLNYQKDLQKQIFAREDNAVSRRAADLKNAGLSKTLAAGDAAGAGTAVSTSAPQLSMVDKVAAGLSYAQQMANVRKTEEETQNLLVQQREAESRMLSQDLERQFTNVKLAIEKGNLDMLPLTRHMKESEINRTNAQIRQIDEIIKASVLGRSIDTYKYKNILPNEAVQSALQVGLLRKQGGKLDADIAYRNLERDLLAHNITSAMWQSRILQMDAKYQETYGYKPGTSGTLGSLFTGLFDQLGGDSIMDAAGKAAKSGLSKIPFIGNLFK